MRPRLLRFRWAVVLLSVSVLIGSAINARELLPEPTRIVTAPDFTTVDTTGQRRSMDEFHGKVLIVNFWATWCPPCIKEMPSLQRIQATVEGDGVQVLAISVGDDAEAVRDFAARLGLDFTLLLDEDMTLSSKWEVKGLPTTYIVDRQGRIVHQVLGEREWDDPQIIDRIRALARDAG